MMRIRPLWLRERLAFRLYLRHLAHSPQVFRRAPLHFTPHVTLDLHPGDVGHAVIALTGFYELQVSRRIAGLAKKGGTLVDVGANYGYYSCLWAGARESNRVIAIEASPGNLPALRENVSRNGLGSRVQIIGQAVGKRNGLFPLALVSEDQTGWAGLAPSRTSSPVTPAISENTITVCCRRLDSLLGELSVSHVDVLKIDVEGADTWVLFGAKRLLEERRIQHVFFEHNSVRMARLGIGPAEARDWLEKHGYRTEAIDEGEWHARIRDELQAYPRARSPLERSPQRQSGPDIRHG